MRNKDSQSAIQISHLSKSYRIGEYTGNTMLREAIMQMFSKLANHGEKKENTVWALKDISFEVNKGESLGIIGRNGAGKSTLLKVLSKITYPTGGAIHVNGRISSLLEVGTGFHEELTGRDNIFLNGSILGMKRHEIERHLEAIIDFSGVERFIDTPIKRYSSGMRLRLGFAVAAHLSSDILLVDEVLAVGDAAFQKKCLDSMEGLSTSGRTVLFVSHNMAAIENLCSRCIWIDGGAIRADGDARTIVGEYMKTFAKASSGSVKLDHIESRSGNGDAKFTSLEFLNSGGEVISVIRSADKLTVRIYYRAYKTLPELVIGLNILTEYGTLVAASNNVVTGDPVPRSGVGEGYADFEIESLYLLPGRYYLSLWLGKWEEQQDVLKNCISFDVEPSDYYGSGKGIDSLHGILFFPSCWKMFPAK
ncbi:MAG: ABC transporter ATP-binding protein [Pseudomonadota bacterium]